MRTSPGDQGSATPRTEPHALPPSDRERLADVADLYWVQGRKVEDVGKTLGISRSTVSRMLARARAEGVVEFTVHRTPDPNTLLRQAVESRYRVFASIPLARDPHSSPSRLAATGRDAAAWLGTLIRPNSTITVAWGTTVETMSTQLRPHPFPGMHVVQMHGSANLASLGTNYAGQILDRFGAAFDAKVHYFPVPAFFDSTLTREAMWREKSIRQVLDLRAKANFLVTSVGTPDGDLPGHLYDSGYLDQDDLTQLRAQHVVGNLGAVFFRQDGSTDGIPLNARTTGLPFDQIRRIHTRMLVAADPAKAPAVRAALASGLVTHVVLDSSTAQAVLAE